MKRWILSVAVGMAISAVPTNAHHSIVGVYNTRQEVTIEGVITQFQFVNPHPFMTIDVKNSSGNARWTLEMDNRRELAQVGMTSETFKQGDQIVVTGNPAHTGRQSLYIRRLDRPADGFQYEQVGNSPRIRPAR